MESRQLNDRAPEVEDNSGEAPFGNLGAGSDEEYSVQTPEQKLGSRKGSQDYISETFSGSGSTDISSEGGSESMSSSSSSSDAESGTYNLPIATTFLQEVNGREVLQHKVIESEAEAFDMKENLPMADRDGIEGVLKQNDMSYQDLLESVTAYDVELNFTKDKLQASQEEVARLKYENLTLVEELGRTIEKLRTSEGNMKEIELQLRSELQAGRDELQSKLDLANQNVHLLQVELASEKRIGSEMQEMIFRSTNDLSEFSREVEELKSALHDAQKDFSKDKSQFRLDISCLHKQNEELETRLVEAEMQNKLLEEQIQQYEVEKMETRKLHEAQETSFLDHIRQLNVHLTDKEELVDSMNKTLDSSKLKYDMLVAEKDEMFAQLQKLGAEMNSREISIQQMEDRMSKLAAEHSSLAAESEKIQMLVEELKQKVVDQEKELEQQRVIIGDRAEEKREAIRQLCSSLEYYRNEYLVLCQAFPKHKQPAVLAS